MEPVLRPWSITAVNLPEHADNPVHTDVGARAAGFEAALVAGTTTHGYLTHPAAAGWGEAWLDRGWSELRLKAPVFDGVTVDLIPVTDEAGPTTIEAQVDGDVKATLAVALELPTPEHPWEERQMLETLPSFTIDLADSVGDYGRRAGDDLDLYRTDGRAHPSVWSVLGNRATSRNYVDGPWVHVRSEIRHVGLAMADDRVTVRPALLDRFDSRAGERVVLAIEAVVDDRVVALIEHESIVRLR